MVRPETNVRLTDVLGDRVLQRLGNTGNELLSDTIDFIHTHLGHPIEVTASNPQDLNLAFGPGVYTLPNGVRIASLREGRLPAIVPGTINFQAGTISTGTAPTFTIPTLGVGFYFKAIIQYNTAANAMGVVFGASGLTLGAATIPAVATGFDPICLVELHSTNGTSFDAIAKTALVRIVDSMDFDPDPVEEVQTVIAATQTVFTLTQIRIPPGRSKLSVFKNGIRQIQTAHYIVTSDTVVTFTAPVLEFAEVLFRVE